MQESKQLARQAKDYLSVCLAKGIDTAMVAVRGPQWFANFYQEDQLQERPILQNGQQNIRDLDLQALLKILRFRETYANEILYYYRFIDGTDAFADQGQKRQLRSLLDRLITEFRNQMEAHTRVADIEKDMNKQSPERLYGYKEALADMEKLAGIFKVITDSDGISYYHKIQKLSVQPPQKKKKRIVPVLLLLIALIGGAVVTWFLTKTPEPAPEKTVTGPTTGNVFYKPDNVKYKEGELTLSMKHVYYEDDELVVHCYVLNGMDRTVGEIEMEKLIIRDADKQLICAGSFGALKGVRIHPYDYVEWTFRFPAELVTRKDAALETLNYTYSFQYAS